MKKHTFLIICLLLVYAVPSVAATDADTCVVNFGEDDIDSGVITAYSATMSTDHSHLADYDQYRACKQFCESAQLYQAKKGSCLVHGEEIEASSYKDIYYETLPMRCTIYQAHEPRWLYHIVKSGDISLSSAFGFSSHILDSEVQCSDQVSQVYSCRNGNSPGCIAFYGEESLSAKSHVYAGLYLYKYYILSFAAILLAAIYLIRKLAVKVRKTR